MPDREKVVVGLERCKMYNKLNCDKCPYDYNGRGNWKSECTAELATDAIALLKEQGWHLLTEDDDGIIHGLPGNDDQYLMTDGKDIWIDDYVNGVVDGIILDSGRDIREITAWMYMPELPKKNRR